MDIPNHQLSVRDLIKLSTRIFTVKPTRTILTILGTAIGIATVVFLISLGYGLQYILLGKLITTEDSLVSLEASMPQEAGTTISQNEIFQLQTNPKISEISAEAEFSGDIKSKETTGLVLVRMVNPSYFRLSGKIPDLGKTFGDNEPGAIITNQAAQILNLPMNETTIGHEVSVEIVYQDDAATTSLQQSKQPLRITGIITSETEPPAVYVPLNQYPEPPFYKDMFIKAKSVEDVEALRDQLVEKGYIISARIDLITQARKILNIITMTLGVFGIAALLVSALGMFNTMIVSFLERTYEVGVMKSLGATDKDVRNLFLMESLIMGFAGGVAGVAIGMGAGFLLNQGLNIFAKRLGGQPLTLFITPLWFILVVILSSAFIGLFSGFWPARRATNLSPKEAFLRK